MIYYESGVLTSARHYTTRFLLMVFIRISWCCVFFDGVSRILIGLLAKQSAYHFHHAFFALYGTNPFMVDRLSLLQSVFSLATTMNFKLVRVNSRGPFFVFNFPTYRIQYKFNDRGTCITD